MDRHIEVAFEENRSISDGNDAAFDAKARGVALNPNDSAFIERHDMEQVGITFTDSDRVGEDFGRGEGEVEGWGVGHLVKVR